jgi:hypothetical protein
MANIYKNINQLSINKSNQVVLEVVTVSPKGNVTVVDSELVVKLPDMFASERNQMVAFVKRLSVNSIQHLKYSISREFNKVRRTFLRDLAKAQNQISDLVSYEIGEDSKAIYIYKAPLLEEVKPMPSTKNAKGDAKPRTKS